MPSCPICEKVYISPSAYQRHITACKFIPPSSIINNASENLPSYSEMCGLLQQLTIKCAEMEKKIVVLETIINTKKKKVGVFEWLNTNIAPPLSYLDWVKTIKVKPSNLHYLFENNIVDSVVNIITTAISADTVIPFYAFGKSQIFYVMAKVPIVGTTGTNTIVGATGTTTTGTTTTGEWFVAEVLSFTKLFKHVETGLWAMLGEWKTKNLLDDNDAMMDKYQRTILKLTDISYTPNDIYNKMKTKIYNSIKMDIKSIMEDEIIF